jgi:hypothetical protein
MNERRRKSISESVRREGLPFNSARGLMTRYCRKSCSFEMKKSGVSC